MNSKSHNSFPYTHVVGFLLSIALTIATLFVAFKTGLSAGIVMIIIAGLAVAQAGLQLFMFMHMTEGEDRDTKVVHTVYAVFMAVVIVVGSIWVMTAGHPIH
ncbi:MULTISPECIES: cytochrome aa3 quinol oxidase subunit IV [Bacillaceae]|jgi:cytochrome aa3-600 menaquinol oxidase subunit 4|uniref:Quinol oxidase subunit 4 n=2 Tax=Bacillaceae TaxID=186817 RepID=A0A090IUY2_9BACI|nr:MULTISPECIES: cytochrome aa3 quinol oxidase subunit IV [Bacillaceae]NWN95999.1 cytochrome aa3 quinol oxidase subunit IV [Bacillus sp. (in: firmicutes)]KIO62706.1 hypothetical protein B4166_3140 [Caldibacillus thermoamylovorans]KIO64636.1 hypothetical protein B4064_2742 [Caldibacillus thermoamylovorans]KIO66326.1 hypothetical protein B4065_2358 [Caldibacillus thermoamylovorans]KIO71658.1 hypothetical protein B4167_3502 [Caldibacillus thermoamylovorans]